MAMNERSITGEIHFTCLRLRCCNKEEQRSINKRSLKAGTRTTRFFTCLWVNYASFHLHLCHSTREFTNIISFPFKLPTNIKTAKIKKIFTKARKSKKRNVKNYASRLNNFHKNGIKERRVSFSQAAREIYEKTE